MAYDPAHTELTGYGTLAQQLLKEPNLNNLIALLDYSADVKLALTNYQSLGQQIYDHLTDETGYLRKPRTGPLAQTEAEPQYIILLACILIILINKSSDQANTINDIYTAYTQNGNQLVKDLYQSPHLLYIMLFILHIIPDQSFTFGVPEFMPMHTVDLYSEKGIHQFYKQLNTKDETRIKLAQFRLFKALAFDYAKTYYQANLYTNVKWIRFFLYEHQTQILDFFPSREILQNLFETIQKRTQTSRRLSQQHFNLSQLTWVMHPKEQASPDQELKFTGLTLEAADSSIINQANWLLSKNNKQEWAANALLDHCTACNILIRIGNRHHCRVCGGNYCGQCATIQDRTLSQFDGTQHLEYRVNTRICALCLPQQQSQFDELILAVNNLSDSTFNFLWLQHSSLNQWQQASNSLMELLGINVA